MIVYGTRGKVIQGQQINNMACKACGNQSHSTFGVLRYFHIFWIPVFPTMQAPGTECLKCKQTLMGKDLPDQIRQNIKSAVFTRKSVLPAFAGLILFAIAVAFAGYAGHEESKKEAAYLEQPAVNDFYIVNLPKLFTKSDPAHPYGILKVNAISGSRLEVIVGNYAYNRAEGARKAITKRETAQGGYFAPEPFSLDAGDLKKFKADGSLYAIKRY
jgi:hypothetical protein